MWLTWWTGLLAGAVLLALALPLAAAVRRLRCAPAYGLLIPVALAVAAMLASQEPFDDAEDMSPQIALSAIALASLIAAAVGALAALVAGWITARRGTARRPLARYGSGGSEAELAGSEPGVSPNDG